MEQVTRVLNNVRIQLRNDSAYNWNLHNPIPMKGEMCVETDTGLFKFGDGVTRYKDLPYSASPSLKLTNPPSATDWDHLIGTTAIVDGDQAWILVDNTQDAAVWKRILTLDDIMGEYVGDMLKSKFATQSAEEGYVDKALRANKLSEARTITVDGDLVSAFVEFDGTKNVILNAALVDIMELAGGGTFVKVQVDSKGRVVGYEALLPTDIPTLTLDKISDAGTAASRNVGTAIGQVVIVEDDGKIDASLMPSITITDVFVVGSQAEMLALKADQGDFVIRTDSSETFILSNNEPEVLGNWIRVENPLNGIQSINGKVGPNVTLNTDDIDEGENNLYYTDERVLDIMSQQATTMFTDGASIIHDTDILILNGGNAALN